VNETCRVAGGRRGVDSNLQLCPDDMPCERPARYEMRSVDYSKDEEGVPLKGTFSFACQAHGDAWVTDFAYSGWRIAKVLVPESIVIEEDMDARDLLVADARPSTP
jgi:hypothetical protein